MFFKGTSGAGISDLPVQGLGIDILDPDVLLLHAGGNDLSGGPGLEEQGPKGARHVEWLAHDLIGIAERFVNSGIKMVFVAKLYYRARGSRLSSDSEVGNYNRKVDVVNRELDRLSHSLNPDVVVWNHKGRVQSAHEILDKDGTHLNDLGMKKHWWSWRRALVDASGRLVHG